MPTLTVKTKYINKLKELEVYDKWLRNVKKQWDNIQFNCPEMFEVLNNASSFSELIFNSFIWSNTIEGSKYWNGVYADSCDKEED